MRTLQGQRMPCRVPADAAESRLQSMRSLSCRRIPHPILPFHPWRKDMSGQSETGRKINRDNSPSPYNPYKRFLILSRLLSAFFCSAIRPPRSSMMCRHDPVRGSRYHFIRNFCCPLLLLRLPRFTLYGGRVFHLHVNHHSGKRYIPTPFFTTKKRGRKTGPAHKRQTCRRLT